MGGHNFNIEIIRFLLTTMPDSLELHLLYILLYDGGEIPQTTLQKSQRHKTRGSPLPIMFDMVMDTLSSLIEREVRGKRMDTYQVNGAMSITQLMHADDILTLTKSNDKSLQNIKHILDELIKFSGLEVSNNKISTFSKICEEDTSLHNILGFVVSIICLGFPITGKKK